MKDAVVSAFPSLAAPLASIHCGPSRAGCKVKVRVRGCSNKHFEEFSEAAQENYLYIQIKEFQRTTNLAMINMDISNTN